MQLVINVPKERIDGTQMPTKSPCSLFTRNQRYTENKNEEPAAARINNFTLVMLDMANASSFAW